MYDILVRAGCFIGIILLGYILRQVGFFAESDFHVISKIVIKITLTAAIITSFSANRLEYSMLLLSLVGFGFGILLLFLAWLSAKPFGKERQAFTMLNSAGCNIGNFVLPFAQSFLGPVGVMAVSLFDAGNSFICLGGAYSAASMVKSGEKGFHIKPILKNLSKSVPLITYIIMVVLGIFRISLPQPIIQYAGIIGNANAFLAMLMLGVGFHLSGDASQLGDILRILCLRYGLGICLALVSFLVLPLPLEIRQALTILFLSPVASAAPAFTADMKSDFGLASAVNSVSILTSIVLITAALLVIL